jgi:hypothetical protein
MVSIALLTSKPHLNAAPKLQPSRLFERRRWGSALP